MNRAVNIVAFFVAIGLFAATTLACLWDYDTLRDERRGLPGVAEVLAGRWERHSPFFYEDRVKRMTELLVREPANLDEWDNLAVAYQKLGQTDKAIETILAKDKLKPGEYTTHANLGTFYMLSGRLPEAIAEIELAIKINPDAHFGREKYQLQLARFLARTNPDGADAGKTFMSMPTLSRPARPPTTSPSDRAAWRAQLDSPEVRAEVKRVDDLQKAWRADREHAIEGIVGMIRFGTDQSPDLYAALGELLASRRDAHLAWRAYQRAIDLGFRDSAWANEHRNDAAEMTEDKSEFSGDVIARERADAAAWVQAYQTFEDDLIRAGKDPSDDALLAPFYAEHGTARESTSVTMAERSRIFTRDPVARVATALLLAIAAIIVVPLAMRFTLRRLRRRIA